MKRRRSVCHPACFRPLSLLVMLTLLLGTLSAVPSAPATAQEDCPDGQVLDEASGECVEDTGQVPDAEPTPTEADEPDEVTVETPVDSEEAVDGDGEVIENLPAPGLEIAGYRCPAGIAQELPTLGAGCLEPASDVSYSVLINGEPFAEGKPESGQPVVRFPEIAAGALAIEVNAPDSYARAFVYCQIQSADGEVTGALFEFASVSEFRAEPGGVEDGQFVFCAVFIELVDDGTQPTPTATSGAMDEEPTPTTADEPVNDETGETATIIFVQHWCPAELDVQAASLDDLVASCTVGADTGMPFIVTSSGQPAGSGTSSGSPSTITFANVPVDKLEASQMPAVTDGPPAVWCEILDATGGVLAEYAAEPVVGTASITGTLTAGAVLSCDWFNATTRGDQVEPGASPESLALIPQDNDDDPPDLDGGSITVTAYQCLAPRFQLPDEILEAEMLPEITEDDSDGGGGTGGGPGGIFDDITNIDDLPVLEQAETGFERCTPTHTGIDFFVAIRGNQIYSQTVTSSGYPAVAAFPFVWPEGIYLMQPPPQNYSQQPIVVCTSSINGPMRFEGQASAYGIVMYDMQLDEELVCNWYNFQIAAPGNVVINTRLCEEASPLREDNYQYLKSTCQTVINNFEVGIRRGGVAQDLIQVVGADGMAEFNDVSPGQIAIYQQTDTIWQYPAVYCRYRFPGEPGFYQFTSQPIVGQGRTAIMWELQPNQNLYCDWFVHKGGFIRLNDGLTVLGLHFSACPAGFDPASSTIYDFAATCHDQIPVITTRLTQAEGGTATAVSDSPEFNFAEFAFINGEPVTLEVTKLPEYERVIPFCDPRLDGIPGNGPMNPLPVTGQDQNIFTVPLLPDTMDYTIADCSIYYILPGEGEPVAPPSLPATTIEAASIVIGVHACPAGIDPATATVASLSAACVKTQPGVEFTAVPVAGDALTAVAAGDFVSTAEFPRLRAGTWAISQAPPEGFSQSIVYCTGMGTERSSPARPEAMPVSKGTIVRDVRPGEAVVCEWFNLPDVPVAGRRSDHPGVASIVMTGVVMVNGVRAAWAA